MRMGEGIFCLKADGVKKGRRTDAKEGQGFSVQQGKHAGGPPVSEAFTGSEGVRMGTWDYFYLSALSGAISPMFPTRICL